MSGKNLLAMVIALLLLSLGLSSVFTIQQGQEGLLLRLGKLVTNPSTKKVEVLQPGLHFKIPFIEHTKVFDTRLQTLDIQSSRIITEQKKDVLVDYYVKWRIDDLPLYYTRTGGNVQQAENLLEQQLNDSLRAQFGKRTIQEVVSDDRSAIMSTLLKQADTSAEPLGIQVSDVRIKRIDLPSEVSAAVFERMRAERERVATELRSQGKAQANAIRAAADAEVTVITATAQEQAAQTKAKGDAKAAKIYAQAYSKDPSFFAFYRSLGAYVQAFSKSHGALVLNPSSQFFQYFNSDGSTTTANTTTSKKKAKADSKKKT